MKIFKLLLLSGAVVTAVSVRAQVQNRLAIPDIEGYKTLQCDFHIHTVFSDGTVWPTVRVNEAYREGLDAISLTEHIEYRPHKDEIVASHGRSYDVAAPGAKRNDVILIRGSEITRPMAPGHFNAIFLTDCDALDQKDWHDSFAEARRQGAFIFWNHPAWDSQQPNETLWWPEHTEIYDNGWMQGIEVVNGPDEYSPEAHRWAIDKGLTMLGNTDIHAPSEHFIDGNHRTMTLVFASQRTPEAIHEALKDRRTAVYYQDKLIGREQFLRAIFDNSIEVTDVRRTGTSVSVTFKNNSGLPFSLKKTGHDPEIIYFREYEIKPYARHTITVKFPEGKKGSVNFEIANLLVAPDEALEVSYEL
jgi:predicted metal-dependent phosphoesterase TrpH